MSGIYYFMFFLLLIAGGVMFYIGKTYKHTLIVKRLAGNAKLVSSEKMRLIENLDGSKDFQLLGSRRLPRPPENALNLNAKGGYVIEAYYDGNQYHWIIDTTTQADMPHLKPFTQNHRTFMTLENAKADRDEGSDWKKHLPMIAGGLVIVIVLFMAYMTYENWNETAVQLNAQNVQIANSNVEIAEIIGKIDKNLQSIENKLEQGIPD
jgi:hypothetical protein